MTQRMRIGRVAGIEVRVDWSLAAIFLLLTWVLATVSFPTLDDGYGAVAYWIVAATTTVVFLASLLAHELAHSLMARRYGIEVASITLWLFGGVSLLRGEARSPAADFRIAVVGPLTSVALGAGFLIVAIRTLHHARVTPKQCARTAACRRALPFPRLIDDELRLYAGLLNGR